MSFTKISIFPLENNNLCYISKYRQRLHLNTYFLIILTSFTDFFNTPVCNFDDVGKINLTKVFLNKGYDTLTFVMVFVQIQ